MYTNLPFIPNGEWLGFGKDAEVAWRIAGEVLGEELVEETLHARGEVVAPPAAGVLDVGQPLGQKESANGATLQ